jgi:hypothetical protein
MPYLASSLVAVSFYRCLYACDPSCTLLLLVFLNIRYHGPRMSRKKLKEMLFIDNGKTGAIWLIEKSETQICTASSILRHQL